MLKTLTSFYALVIFASKSSFSAAPGLLLLLAFILTERFAFCCLCEGPHATQEDLTRTHGH